MAGESESAVEGKRIFPEGPERECVHMRGPASTLHCAYVTDDCLRKNNGSNEQVYLWYCYCDVCRRKTDMVLTVGEAMERAEFGWFQGMSTHDRLRMCKAERKHMPDPVPPPKYEYESDIWENDLGMA